MTVFSTIPDDRLREMMNLHFGIITGMQMPTPKGKGADLEGWKREFSFVNLFAFRTAFLEASSRGICSPAETIAGNEILAIIG